MFSSLRALSIGLALSAGMLASGVATAADERVVIHFVDIGNIRDWHAESSEVLYVRNLNDKWYRITFAPPCQALPFAIGISFETDSLGDVDKNSSILVGDERCWFKSIEESAAPEAETEE